MRGAESFMKYFKTRPIKLQLLVILCIFVGVIILIMYMTYNQSTKIIYQKNENYSVELLDKMTEYVQSQMEQIHGIIESTLYNPDIHYYLKTSDLLDKYDLFQKVDKQVTTISQLHPGVVDITIIGENGNNVNLMSDSGKKEAVMSTVAELALHKNQSAKPYYTRLIHTNTQEDYYIIGARINDIFPTNTLGYIIVILDLNAIFPKFNTLLEHGFGSFYVLDRYGIINASNDKSRIGEKLETASYNDLMQTANIVLEMELPDIQGKVVNVYSKSDLFRGMDKIRTMYGWLLLFFIPLMGLILWIISRNIVEPIRSFIRFIQIVKTGELNQGYKRLELSGYHEIMIMANKFNDMLDEINRLTDEVVASKTRIYALGMLKKQAELAFLKQQVNPHFLYNMLESLKGMAQEIGAKEMKETISALGRMLRYSIKGQEEVTLREELTIANYYIALQQFRFEDRFEVHVDVQDDLLNCMVIKMLLQPILENAITHGLEMKMGKGHLWCSGYRTTDGNIVLQVKDDGAGMGPDQLNRLQQVLDIKGELPDLFQNQEHLGIINVHYRLRTTYGEPYGLKLDSVLGEGTEVQLILPCEEVLDDE
ncbi:signal transduction histidine kinase [Paenibacillus agaridevorans]|uniref:Signal transduction histidine kinase n=1 Tax=Paenibacillus agaridevorans TaxID=171404 RepID=A0A2R5EIM1_9BACL|nr:histidine kinase [Paenibacillus agaridevorans]GBG06450.1 signal transduction histidine kinase [Paenibacillus agaridevorans]